MEVTIALDTEPRTVELPAELQTALTKNKTAKVAFDKLPPSRKKAIALLVTEAKTEETRTKRIEKAINELTQ
ncbi:MAG: YdeI/OmpD-associated family protein [Chitinophagaceae bacterium]|nr:YdeI/OmpD-associated family protein [Chitinophagaceae bacterium]